MRRHWFCSLYQNRDIPSCPKKNYLVLLFSVFKFNFIFHTYQQALFLLSSSKPKVFKSKKIWWVLWWFRSLQQRPASHEIIKSAFYKGLYRYSNVFLFNNHKIDFLQQGSIQILDVCGRRFDWKAKAFATSIMIPMVRNNKIVCCFCFVSMIKLLFLSN